MGGTDPAIATRSRLTLLQQRFIFTGIGILLGVLALLTPFLDVAEPAEYVGGWLVWAALLEILHGFRRAESQGRISAWFSGAITLLIGILMVNAELSQRKPLVDFILFLFLLDAGRYLYLFFQGPAQREICLVGLIPMWEFEESKTPPVTFIPAGQGMPGAAAEISIADSIVPSVKHAAVYIVNQAEGTVHYYMEGMAAPMGAFRNYGHETRAIEIVDRSLGEWSPGVYAGRVRPPVEGTYNIAFMMDAPRFVHCFSAKVEPNPKSQAATAAMAVEYQVADRRVPAGSSTKVKFKLTEPATGKPRENVTDVTVMYYGLDGRGRTVVPARPLGKGLYEADVKVERVTTYYVFVGTRSLRLNYTDLPFLSLMGTPAPVSGSGAKAGAGGSP